MALKAVSYCSRLQGSSPSRVQNNVRQAAALNVDLIAMGTHGRTGLQHMLLGSVAGAADRRSLSCVADPIVAATRQAVGAFLATNRSCRFFCQQASLCSVQTGSSCP